MRDTNIVPIQFSTNLPKYRQVYAWYREHIESGSILPGDRLPSIRQLSAGLGVNTVTVVKAFDLLEADGLVVKRAGSGVFAGRPAGLRPAPTEALQDEELFGDDEISLMQQGSIFIPEEVCNLATSTPTAGLFPIAPFQAAINRVLDRDGGNAFLYDESNGYYPLRQHLSSLLQGDYGLSIPADRLQIISGAQQGLDITAKALISPGDCVLVEDPSYTGALAVFRSRGANVVGIPLLPDGIDLAFLEQAVSHYRPKALYIMPDFQNPTGISYADEKRRRLLGLAREHRFYIIEDDYISDLHYTERREHLPLKTYDREEDERVIYIKSFSKLVMPGLRLGFLTAPEALTHQLLKAKHLSDISSSAFIQRAFAEYMASGILGRHLESIRGVYRERFGLLVRAVERHLGNWTEYRIAQGGFNLWLQLPDHVSALTLYGQAAAEGILVTPGNVFRSGTRDFDSYIRLSIAGVSNEEIDPGIAALARVLLPLMHAKKKDRTGRFSPIM